MLAVYAGQTCIGHIYQRSKAGFEAFNTDDRSIGLFGSQREAADALSSGGLHAECWSSWHRARKTDAIAALGAMGIVTATLIRTIDRESGATRLSDT
jgi:hypothetical protein